jgi:hypothetical protein
VSSKQRPGPTGKGRPTPKRSTRGPQGRPTATRSTGRRSTTGPVYRQRRHPPLPLALKVAMAVAWLAALVATVLTVDPWTGRIGVMIVVTMVLVLFVVLVFNPSRRKAHR